MQMTLQNQNLNVNKWNYGCYSSDNYGANSIAIELGTRTVYYSYNTVIAFKGYNSKENTLIVSVRTSGGQLQANTLIGLTQTRAKD